jgi:hypothetical protein
MDLSRENLISKYKEKAVLGVEDVQVALAATPFLCRELLKVEDEVKDLKKRVEHLKGQLKKNPPGKREGKRGKASWLTEVDEERNLLKNSFAGIFDTVSAKLASNAILTVFSNIRSEFDTIFDFTKLERLFSRKIIFHMKKVVYNFKQVGVGRVILIVTKETKPLKAIFEEREMPFQLFTVDSLEEAEKILKNDARGFLKA